ncbi:MAG: hypothetical protein CM15mP73_0050 [Hyphomicrobiales bacterium]|nr:MAG: hypothetical protein CM15mP73_0050 [Hyphomicrobiales bacterium]
MIIVSRKFDRDDIRVIGIPIAKLVQQNIPIKDRGSYSKILILRKGEPTIGSILM